MTITIMDIFHNPVFYLKDTMFRRLGSASVFRWNLSDESSRETETSTIYWTHMSTFYLKTEIEYSFRSAVMDNVQNCDSYINIYS
jgi:hypothetical protein